MNYKQYAYINKTLSSEMFYSLMAILHEKLPCAPNFFRLRKKFRDQLSGSHNLEKLPSSPVRTIASPKIIRGLSITKALKKDRTEGDSTSQSRVSSPDIRIKGSRARLQSSRLSEVRNIKGNKGPGQTQDLTDTVQDFQAMSLGGGLSALDEDHNPAKSPHKLTRGGKLQRFNERKQVKIKENTINLGN